MGVAFGPFVGFLAGVLYQLMAAFAVASVASAFAGSVAAVWAPAATPAGRAVLLVVLMGVVAAVNVRGVRFGAFVVETATVAKLLPLVVLVAVGLWSVNPESVRFPDFPAPAALGRTAIVLIFAFLGVEIALVPSGEVRDPARTVPRALFLALAITTTLYLLIQRVAQGLLGPAIADFASAPLAEAASRVLGSGGRLLVIGGAIVSMFGYVAGDMLGSPRSLYAFGRDGVLPAALARVHPRFHTPHVAIVCLRRADRGAGREQQFHAARDPRERRGADVVLTCVAASSQLQRRDVRADGAPFRLPGGPAVPMLAATVIVWLLSNATPREFGDRGPGGRRRVDVLFHCEAGNCPWRSPRLPQQPFKPQEACALSRGPRRSTRPCRLRAPADAPRAARTAPRDSGPAPRRRQARAGGRVPFWIRHLRPPPSSRGVGEIDRSA